MKKSTNPYLPIYVLLLLLLLPVAYYFLYALPTNNAKLLELEQEKYQREQDAIFEEELAEAERQENLDYCLLNADLNYSHLWNSQCEAWKVEVDTAWRNCRNNSGFMTDEQNKNYCISSTPDYDVDENGSCLLPTTRTDRIEQQIKEEKDECYRRY